MQRNTEESEQKIISENYLNLPDGANKMDAIRAYAMYRYGFEQKIKNGGLSQEEIEMEESMLAKAREQCLELLYANAEENCNEGCGCCANGDEQECGDENCGEGCGCCEEDEQECGEGCGCCEEDEQECGEGCGCCEEDEQECVEEEESYEGGCCSNENCCEAEENRGGCSQGQCTESRVSAVEAVEDCGDCCENEECASDCDLSYDECDEDCDCCGSEECEENSCCDEDCDCCESDCSFSQDTNEEIETEIRPAVMKSEQTADLQMCPIENSQTQEESVLKVEAQIIEEVEEKKKGFCGFNWFCF